MYRLLGGTVLFSWGIFVFKAYKIQKPGNIFRTLFYALNNEDSVDTSLFSIAILDCIRV